MMSQYTQLTIGSKALRYNQARLYFFYGGLFTILN